MGTQTIGSEVTTHRASSGGDDAVPGSVAANLVEWPVVVASESSRFAVHSRSRAQRLFRGGGLQSRGPVPKSFEAIRASVRGAFDDYGAEAKSDSRTSDMERISH